MYNMISEVEPELDDFIPAVNASHLIQFFPILSEQIMRKIELLFFLHFNKLSAQVFVQ